jgi:hypothetical protein
VPVGTLVTAQISYSMLASKVCKYQ